MRRRAIVSMVVSLTLAGCGLAPGLPTPAVSTTPATATASAPPTTSATPPATATASATASISTASNEAAIVAMIPTADGPITLAATSDSVWVENHRSNFVSRIDPAQDLEVERLTAANVHCGLAAGGDFVWATEAAASSVKKLDAVTGRVMDSFTLADACGVAADAQDVWITSPGPGKVVRYDAQTAKERASVAVAPSVFFVAIGPEAVWVVGEADGGTVYRIDPATNTVVAMIGVPNPFATGIAVGHGAVWVPARDNKVIYRIDPSTNVVTTTIKMPSAIGGLGVGPDAIWTSGFGDGKVYRIDPTTNQVTASVSTGKGNLGPPIVAFGSVWVAALDQNLVLRIDPAAIQ